MDNKQVRKMLNEYVEKIGTTQTFIAKSIGVNRSTINLFQHDKRDLGEDRLKQIVDFINR